VPLRETAALAAVDDLGSSHKKGSLHITLMIRLLIAAVLAVILGPVLCSLSGWIEMGKDFSQEDTVGVITRNGFPVWYRENAPGYSVVDGMHFDRLDINTAIWVVAVFALAVLVLRKRKSATVVDRRYN
jgi:hypothetical protein